jgi:hypothetical protein
MPLTIFKIENNELLENSQEGEIIEHTEWNQVMTKIKDVINSNADVLSNATIIAKAVLIGEGLGYDASWVSLSNGEYSVVLTLDDSYAKNIKTYHIAPLNSSTKDLEILSEVYNSVVYNKNKTITIKTRNNVPTLVTIQGAGV